MRRKPISELLVLALALAAIAVLAVPVVTAGITTVADAASGSAAKTKKKTRKKRPRVRTVTVTRTVTVPAPATVPAGQLLGTFKLTPGSYSNGAAHGSWFRMILPGGTAANGPYFTNPDSAAGDRNFTLLEPGTDGGLQTSAFQPAPTPAFDGNGNALSSRIIRPTRFAGVNFSVATAKTDTQTNTGVGVPVIKLDGGKLSGDVRAFAAHWNNQWFNQGSPKPDGSRPGITAPVTGTYDEKTNAFVLEWASSIVGGPFNGFTGLWHLEGNFVTCAA